jgi:tRNA threonylcarbamoyladenosine biosynthesis protein TsaB
MSSPSLPPAALPCLVALDTATEVAHLALCLGGEVRAQALGGAAQASSTTLPGLQAMLAQAGLGWPAVQAIAFGQGPGAFTGLRTACAIAQGLALGLNLPVIALDTLMAVAESARREEPAIAQALSNGAGPLWVLQDARMSEVYAAAYTWSDGVWLQVQAPVLWPLSHWQAQIEAGHITLAAGSALLAYPAHTESLQAQGALLAPAAQPHGLALALLAQQAWARGDTLDAALALPLYVRDKVAQTTAERTADRTAERITEGTSDRPADRAAHGA